MRVREPPLLIVRHRDLGRRWGQTRQPADDGRAETLSRQDREAIRAAGAQDARRSRAEQGLPERIEDPATAALLAAMLRDQSPQPPQQRNAAA
jgi:hypothetical protein